MFKKFKIDKFNQKYAGKFLMFCPRIYEDITFYINVIAKCCHCQRTPYSPPILFNNIITKFNFDDYLEKLDLYMRSNQTNYGFCKNCLSLKKQIVPPLGTENIKFITINHFNKCNSNCIYCFIKNKTHDINYELLPIIKQLKQQNMISKNVLINWGGGEPTICSEFNSISDFAHKNGYRQAVNSSGIVFSDIILEGLKDGSMSIQISPDSGTEETYYKIKRQNNFHKVWENIKKYAQYPDMLYVKYIFFSLSANENDIRTFIERCKDSGVKRIVIDCESNSANNPNSPFGNINDQILNQAILMKHLAIENNIDYDISYQWKSEHKKLIENS